MGWAALLSQSAIGFARRETVQHWNVVIWRHSPQFYLAQFSKLFCADWFVPSNLCSILFELQEKWTTTQENFQMSWTSSKRASMRLNRKTFEITKQLTPTNRMTKHTRLARTCPWQKVLTEERRCFTITYIVVLILCFEPLYISFLFFFVFVLILRCYWFV